MSTDTNNPDSLAEHVKEQAAAIADVARACIERGELAANWTDERFLLSVDQEGDMNKALVRLREAARSLVAGAEEWRSMIVKRQARIRRQAPG